MEFLKSLYSYDAVDGVKMKPGKCRTDLKIGLGRFYWLDSILESPTFCESEIRWVQFFGQNRSVARGMYLEP